MFPLLVFSNRCPLAPAALPAFNATMDTSDFPPALLPSLLFRLVGKCACRTRSQRDLLGYRLFRLSGSVRPSIPGGRERLAFTAARAVACWRLETIGPFQRGHFGTQHLHGRHYPLPLLLACFRTYASRAMLPPPLQGSIPGPWPTFTGAGVHPLEDCGIAQPRPRPDPNFPRFAAS